MTSLIQGVVSLFYVVCSSNGSKRSTEADDVICGVRCDWSVCNADLCRQRQHQATEKRQTTTTGTETIITIVIILICQIIKQVY